MALFDEDLIRDPGFFKENTIPAHADISYFRNEDELRARSSSFWHSLNGLWKFRWYRTLDADYDSVSWYGNGPEETYADRECGKLGVYCGRVSNMMAPYLRPQESGAHTGVRTALIADEHEHGLSIYGKDLMLSVLPYKPSEIENADHSFDLPEIHYTYVRVGLGQMGVGGDDSWGSRPLPAYMINNRKPLKLKFSFRGV